LLAAATQQALELLRLRSLLAATTQQAPEILGLRSLLVATQQAPEAPGLAYCCNTASSRACLLGFSLLAKKKAFFLFFFAVEGLVLFFTIEEKKKNPKTVNLLPHPQYLFFLLMV
jgi:hypothetical protein